MYIHISREFVIIDPKQGLRAISSNSEAASHIWLSTLIL